MATVNQINYVRSLLAQRVCDADLIARAERIEDLSTRETSSLIGDLQRAPKRAAATAAEVPEGMHKVEDRIYKVQRAVHGSGNLYAKRLVQRGENWSFEYAPGAVRNLSNETRMTLDEARAFGALYGTCCACGRTLTDEASIAAGIGPVCANKF